MYALASSDFAVTTPICLVGNTNQNLIGHNILRGCSQFVNSRFIDSQFVNYFCTSITYSQPQLRGCVLASSLRVWGLVSLENDVQVFSV